MKIGVVSDTHAAQASFRRALDLLRERDITIVLHCGDVGDAATLRMLAGWQAHVVFGNNDWDREGFRVAAAEIGVTLHDPFGSLELEGVKIAFLHGDDTGLLRDLVNAGCYDYVFHGHTHEAADRRVGPTRVINPGALYRARPRSCICLDLADGQVETVVAG